MRTAIFNALFERMAVDDRLMLVVGDMGLGLVERFEEAYPGRYYNVGIAEQNMIGVAAGLINAGFRVCAYTVSQFYLRAFEHIRLECGLNGAPIVMLGTTTGWDNAALGGTHSVTDDWSALKAIPGLDIYCPSSVAYAEGLLDRVLDAGRPAYVRIPKGYGVETNVPDNDVVEYGGDGDTLIITAGSIASECLWLAERRDVSVAIINKLHPLPHISALDSYDQIIVVEDQVQQGLYASVCELQPRGRVEFVGPDEFGLVVKATPEAHWKHWGMDAESLLERIG